MSSADSEDARERLTEAAAWRVRLDRPDAVEADFHAFARWLDEPGAREAFDRVDAVLGEVAAQGDAVRAAMAAEDAARDSIAERIAHPHMSRRAWVLGAGAAAAGGVAIFSASRQWRSFRTAIGETRTATLDDGTVIRLNSATKLKVALREGSRQVDMGVGEAAFDVAHDASRPFEVTVGERRVRVLGTEFNVLNQPGRVVVTVRRGLVAVEDGAGGAIQLRPDDQLVFANGRALRRTGAAEAAFAWQSGRLIYADASLEELAADLNRYYATPVRVSVSAAPLRFSGVLTLDSEERVIRRLEAFMPIEAVPADDGGYLLRARPD